MSSAMIMEIIYTVLAAVAFAIGAKVYFKKGAPLYAQMVVCMLGCRFLQGLFETLMVRGNLDLNSVSLAGLGQLAQLLFLICANYGTIDSLCDDGSKAYRKYRIIAAIVPLAVVAYFFLTKRGTTDTTPEVVMRLFSVVIPMIALYFHVKHLIIKDVEGGLIKNLRFYNLLGVLNCLAFFVGLFTMPMSVPWYIAFIIYDIVTIAILPALRSGLKKLNI